MKYRGVSTTVSAAVAVAFALTAIGCSSSDNAVASTTTQMELTDRDLRLNELQYIGTHNSYHVAPEPDLFAAEKAAVEAFGEQAAALGDIDALLYTHDSLTEQLQQGIRAFELDVFADPAGGLFAAPLAPALLGIDATIPQHLDEPGYKVIHIQDIDFMSTCSTFVRCLREIETWSSENPSHLPIFIQVEIKDDPLPAPLDATKVVTVGSAELDALDDEIRSVFREERLITPDTVRGNFPTLANAIQTSGWPSIGASLGKVVFFLDNGGDVHTAYLDGAPSLQGRAAFTSAAEPGDADRAIVKRNDPLDPQIASDVRDGLIVRTRADADLVEAATNNTGPRDAALASGAHIISTDYPSSKTSDTGYVVTFGQAIEARCNAVVVRSCPTWTLNR